MIRAEFRRPLVIYAAVIIFITVFRIVLIRLKIRSDAIDLMFVLAQAAPIIPFYAYIKHLKKKLNLVEDEGAPEQHVERGRK